MNNEQFPVNNTLIHPSEMEMEALDLFYNRFLDVYQEIKSSSFEFRLPGERLKVIKELFAVYSELCKYEPIKVYLHNLDKNRPPSEKFIARDCLKFIRNIFFHYPLFDTWDDIYITKSLANWSGNINHNSIDKFLQKCIQLKEKDAIQKFRVWDNYEKRYSYYSFSFPRKYDNERIYIKDIISEKTGIEFCSLMMLKVLAVQLA